jgi:hypothetical protein
LRALFSRPVSILAFGRHEARAVIGRHERLERGPPLGAERAGRNERRVARVGDVHAVTQGDLATRVVHRQLLDFGHQTLHGTASRSQLLDVFRSFLPIETMIARCSTRSTSTPINRQVTSTSMCSFSDTSR